MKNWLPALAALAAALLATPAQAYCSKPIEPHCAVRGEVMGNSYITAKDCRRKVDDHLEKLARYQSCLQEMIEESETESTLYKNLMAAGSAETEPETGPEAKPE